MTPTSTPPGSPWLSLSRAAAPGDIALICFPYAGGSAALYRIWSRLLPEYLVAGVELPGHGTRLAEPLFTGVEALCDGVLPDLLALRAGRHVLLGHSMGGLLAYEVTRRLEAAGRPPEHLVVSGAVAPHLPSRIPPLHHLEAEEFLPAALRLGLAAPAMAEHPELAELFTPVLRADLLLVEAYSHRHGTPLATPTTVLGGTADPYVLPADLNAWHALTGQPPDVRMLPGGHLFIEEHRAEVVTIVRALLADRCR